MPEFVPLVTVGLNATTLFPLNPAQEVVLTVANPIVPPPAVFENKPAVPVKGVPVKVIRGLAPVEPSVPPLPTKFTVADVLPRKLKVPLFAKFRAVPPAPPLCVTLTVAAPEFNVMLPTFSVVPALLPSRDRVPPRNVTVAASAIRPVPADVLPPLLSITNDPPRIAMVVPPMTPLVLSPVPVSLSVEPLLMP